MQIRSHIRAIGVYFRRGRGGTFAPLGIGWCGGMYMCDCKCPPLNFDIGHLPPLEQNSEINPGYGTGGGGGGGGVGGGGVGVWGCVCMHVHSHTHTRTHTHTHTRTRTHTHMHTHTHARTHTHTHRPML